jgi:hypothetical protein
MQDREPVLRAFGGFGGVLREALEQMDEAHVRAWLERGAAWRRGVEG